MKINFILPDANLSGGIKANRLIADALVRRGHVVRLVFPLQGDTPPKPWQLRQWYRKAKLALALRSKQKHHLDETLAEPVPVRRATVTAGDVPDADVTFGTYWKTLEWMRSWPAAKGLQAHFVRGHEIYGADAEQVRAIFRTPNLKVVVSSWLERLMREEYGARRVARVPDGIDPRQFRAAPRSRHNPPVVGFVHSNEPVKDMATMLGALQRVQKQIPDLKIVSFGAYDPIEEETGLRNFTFHLRPAQDRIPEIYAQADGWILSSRSEGFGLPPLEAAACGCPMVCTACGGPEDYIQDGVNGFIVPTADAAALADRIVRVLLQPEAQWQQMSRAAQETSRRFDWDRSAAVLEQALLQELGRETALNVA